MLSSPLDLFDLLGACRAHCPICSTCCDRIGPCPRPLPPHMHTGIAICRRYRRQEVHARPPRTAPVYHRVLTTTTNCPQAPPVQAISTHSPGARNDMELKRHVEG